MKKLIRSFGFAGSGVLHCLLHERHFRIHIVAAVYVLAFASGFSLTRVEWAVLLLTVGLVPAAEAINTAVERAVDLGASFPHPLAKIAKDSAAGAVLICAVTAVVVGVVLFARPAEIAALFCALWQTRWKLVLTILSVPAAFLFVFAFGKEEKITPTKGIS